MPWQLKNPTFSFSLRPMLSKHWLVSTFLIWRKERGETFLKIFPGPAGFVQKIAICEQVTFPNNHGMVWGWRDPKAHPWDTMREFRMIIPNLSKSPFFFCLLPWKTTEHSLGMCSWRPGAAHLWFPPFSLDVSPGGATQGRTRIIDAAPAWRDQILPKSLVKGRKTSQKCTSNTLKFSFLCCSPFSCSTGTVLIPSSCLSCSLHGNWGHTAQIRSFNHYFLPSSSHFPAWQRGTIPLYLTFPRQALSWLEIPIPLYFGRIKPAILQCLLFLPTMAIFNGMSKKKKKAICSLECYSTKKSFDCYSIIIKCLPMLLKEQRLRVTFLTVNLLNLKEIPAPGGPRTLGLPGMSMILSSWLENTQWPNNP